MDAIAWVQTELRSLEAAPAQALLEPPQTFDSLCAYLKDGRALCLLTMALQNDAEMPKHLTRGMHQVTTFHALERIQFFLKWCRGYASLEEHVVFTSVQLVDEAHEKAVAATIHALRVKYRPSWVAPVFETAVEKTDVAEDAPQQQGEVADEPQEEDEVQEEEQDEELSDDVVYAPAPVEAAKMAFKSRSNRLNSFLNKFPGSEPKPAMAAVVASATAKTEEAVEEVVEEVAEKEEDTALASTQEEEEAVAPEAATTTAEEDERPAASRLRIPSIFKRDARGSGSASTARSSTGSASSAQSPRSTVDSVATSATAASTEAPEPEASTLPRLGSVSKLEIPSVFGRHSSGAESATSDSATTPKTAPRSVSKLQIPSAFSSSSSSLRTSDSSASTAQDSAAAAAPTTPTPTAPRSVSKLEIPSAFSRVKSNSSSSEQAAPEPATPTPPKASPLAAFSPVAVASVSSAPADDHNDDELLEVRPHLARSISAPVKDNSPASKLAAFLSKVETANTFVSVAAPAPVVEEVAPEEEEVEEDDVEEEEEEEVEEDAHEEEEDAENHPFEHHDHNDGEQPFFVVEEVSLSKPPTSSKLFAFLSAVDSATPAVGGDESADLANSSPRSAHEKPVSRSASTSSYQSDEHVSLTEDIPADVESPLAAKLSNALETNERLVAEVAELKQELAVSNDALSSKDLEISALKDELQILKSEQSTSFKEAVEAKEQELLALKAELGALKTECEDITSKFTASQSELESKAQKIGAIQEKSDALELQLGAELASAYATIDELNKEGGAAAPEVDISAQIEAALQAAKEEFAQQKLALEQQLEELRAQTQSQKTEITSIREDMVELERVAQQAKDSEEAARYSAQVAFAARDEAEEVSRLQREELDTLRQQ